MAFPCIILFTPIDIGIDGIAEMKLTGMPVRSTSRDIVAPQRLQDPQVATKSTPSTRADRRVSAISAPFRLQSIKR